MSKKIASVKVKKRHTELKKIVSYHNERYHSHDSPEISDFEYDQFFNELLELEKQYNDLDTSDSPSHKVGGKTHQAFQKVKHRQPMLSLSNSYNETDIFDFDERIKKILKSTDPIEYYVELKLDGLSMELIYEHGKLIQAITRGDGEIGEDVTHNIQTITSIPKTISHSDLLEVRGEVLILKNDFKKMNQLAEENEQPLFANARNAAAGTIRQLDSKIAASRPLSFFAYARGITENWKIQKQSEMTAYFKKLGLPTVDKKMTLVTNQLKELADFYHHIESERSQFPFEIDGIVIKVNSIHLQNELGMVARSPRWATAVKFQPEQATTQIENIIIQVGRTGALTPVAIMKPVKVGGVTITNATLHNQDEIDRKDIRIGDTVIVQRAGDVIPEIVSVKKELRTHQLPFIISSICPSCGQTAIKETDEVVLRCVNSNCQSILIESIKHFVSRKAMNMEKVGDKLIESLVTNKIIHSFSDLYFLKAETLLSLERMGEKSVENILQSIQKSKSTQLSRLIYAFGIRYVGEQTAKLIADHYLTMDAFLKTTSEELEKVPEIGTKVSATISNWLQNENIQNEVQKLLKIDFTFEAARRNQSGKFTGLSFLVTGTLPVKRDQAHEYIESHGGKLLSGVSSKLNYLVVGDDPGSKVEKAQSVGTKIISWQELLDMLPSHNKAT